MRAGELKWGKIEPAATILVMGSQKIWKNFACGAPTF